jgi:hypothetical protein
MLVIPIGSFIDDFHLRKYKLVTFEPVRAFSLYVGCKNHLSLRRHAISGVRAVQVDQSVELVHTHLRSSVAISFAEGPSHDQTTCEANALVGHDRRVGDTRIGGDHRGRGLDCSPSLKRTALPSNSPLRMPLPDSARVTGAFNLVGGTRVTSTGSRSAAVWLTSGLER